MIDYSRFVGCESSWLHSYYYDSAESALYVRFKNKKGRLTVTCRYDEIPLGVWMGLILASSKGEFFHNSGLILWPYKIV